MWDEGANGGGGGKKLIVFMDAMMQLWQMFRVKRKPQLYTGLYLNEFPHPATSPSELPVCISLLYPIASSVALG